MPNVLIIGLTLVLVLIVILVYFGGIERFDTYYNHDIGASHQYSLSVPDSTILAKYAWSQKDPEGYTVYDRYYDDYLHSIGNTNLNDAEYAYRDIGALGESNVYDTKFDTMSSVKFDVRGQRIPSNPTSADKDLLSTYQYGTDNGAVGYFEPNIGAYVSLSQKNF